MDLISEHPYWLMRNGIPHTYPSLQVDISTEVVVVGTGISGALVAYYLGKAGINVVQIDRRHAGLGSTVASTSLLQYEIDKPMYQLAEKFGEKDAAKSYELCSEAIDKLEKICNTMKSCNSFKKRSSLQFASYKKDIDNLYKEYELRKKHGFKISWLESEELKKLFGLEADAAVLSEQGGEIDAYTTTHSLIQESLKMGNRIFDNTNVTDIKHHKNGVELKTDTGATIKAKKLVLACGYETLHYIPKKIADLYSTYALVTEPVAPEHIWHESSLIWETATPYLYFRITDDNRILIGGKDDEFYNPEKRDASIKKKAKLLEAAFSKRFPTIPIRTDFRWAGTFATTADGLPYIGTIPQRLNTYFALGFGGNGITYSVIAAEIIRDMITGKENHDAALFSFTR
jgi:glycine/D-amino acid oxidase-like deaminating enzyme